ncbi:MAG: DDE-type integrase/transposase/recombinase, partial [Gammaproteobacteria bacterium]|nr:DDE-type integrase/transposase/recombinase [Gammaproteobacteria bacterium]
QVAEQATGDKALLWHRRFGHLGQQNLQKLVKEELVRGMDMHLPTELPFCADCTDGKMHRLPFPKSTTRASEVLGLVHSDVCGKLDPISLGGAQYFVTFIDDKSRYARVYFIRHKSEVFTKFKEFKCLAEKETGQKLKVLRTDNGGEYTSREMQEFLKNEGIKHHLTVPKTPEQYGVAERLNRTLVEMVRAMLGDSKMQKKFWAEALSTAVYLKNRSPSAAVDKKTPFEAYYGHKPGVKHLKAFGCAAYAHVPKDERKKLDSKANKCWFLGYASSSKGYRLFDIKRGKVVVSRDVVFNENDQRQDKETSNSQKEQQPLKIELSSSEEEPLEEATEEQHDDAAEDENPTDDEPEAVIQVQSPQLPLRRSERERRQPDRFGDWNLNVTARVDEAEPRTMTEALAAPDRKLWEEAAQKEYHSLMENNTWELMKLPEGRKAVDCKWVFKVKHNANGSVDLYKARLVAKGFTQKFGIDYDETFSPVVRFESLRTAIALGARLGMKMHQMDVTTAFLNGTLKEEIYMRQPEGFEVKGKEGMVCKLRKSLYGLKQSSRCWNEALHMQLSELGYQQSDADPCIYVKKCEGSLIILAVYVDDIILMAKSELVLEQLKKELAEKFKMRDMGALHYFLGIKIEQDLAKGSVWLGQERYVDRMLEKYNMAEAKPVSTPMDPNVYLEATVENAKLADQQLYQSAVGSLLYVATATRPDVSAAVSRTAKFCSKPTTEHWAAVKRIFRYLKGTKKFGLLYKQSKESELVSYADADWAGDAGDRRSTSGFVYMLSGGAISWRSKKQTIVALSTAEAEYVALSAATQEGVWLRSLLKSLCQQVEKPTKLLEDNQSAIAIANNSISHCRSKHIDIKYHYVRQKVTEGAIELHYCPTHDMVADVLTKGLSKNAFERQRKALGLIELRHGP